MQTKINKNKNKNKIAIVASRSFLAPDYHFCLNLFLNDPCFWRISHHVGCEFLKHPLCTLSLGLCSCLGRSSPPPPPSSPPWVPTQTSHLTSKLFSQGSLPSPHKAQAGAPITFSHRNTEFFLAACITVTQADLGDTADLVPDHCNTVKVAVKRVTQILWFPSACQSYVCTIL